MGLMRRFFVVSEKYSAYSKGCKKSQIVNKGSGKMIYKNHKNYLSGMRE